MEDVAFLHDESGAAPLDRALDIEGLVEHLERALEVAHRPVQRAQVPEVADDGFAVADRPVVGERLLDQLDGLLVSALVPAHESEAPERMRAEVVAPRSLGQLEGSLQRLLGRRVIANQRAQIALSNPRLPDPLGALLRVEGLEQPIDDLPLSVALTEVFEQPLLTEQHLDPSSG